MNLGATNGFARRFDLERWRVWQLVLAGLLLVICFTWLPEKMGNVLPQESEMIAVEHDLAHALFGADQVIQGARPHRDFFWHYGLLPLHGFAGFARRIGGVSVDAFRFHDWIWGVLNALLMLLLMVRVAGRTWGVITWLLTGFGWFGGGQIYGPYERCALLVLALGWRAPDDRPAWLPWLAGFVLGLMQWVKFGTCFLAGVAWVLVDAMALWHSQAPLARWRQWLTHLLQMLAAFLAMESLRTLHAWVNLGPEAAIEALLPLVHLDWYASYANDPGIRWPGFVNWGFFAGFQVPLLLGLLGAALAGWVVLHRRPVLKNGSGKIQGAHPGAVVPAVLFGIVYALGVACFFRHAHNMMAYGWLLGPGIAALFASLRLWKTRLLVAIFLLPSGALVPLHAISVLGGNYSQTGPGLVSCTFPNGQSLWLADSQARGYRAVIGALADTPSERLEESAHSTGCVIMPMGSGLHFFGNLPLACRHSWFFPGTVRSFERGVVFEQMLQAKAIAVHLDEETAASATDQSSTWKYERWRPFRHEPEDQQLLAALTPPQRLPDGWLVFPLRLKSTAAAVSLAVGEPK